jgi:hypothetical protein
MEGNTVPFNPVGLFRYLNPIWKRLLKPEAEFLDVIWTRVFQVTGFYYPSPHPLEQKCLETGLSENSSLRTFMNLASGNAPSITLIFPDLNSQYMDKNKIFFIYSRNMIFKVCPVKFKRHKAFIF